MSCLSHTQLPVFDVSCMCTLNFDLSTLQQLCYRLTGYESSWPILYCHLAHSPPCHWGHATLSAWPAQWSDQWRKRRLHWGWCVRENRETAASLPDCSLHVRKSDSNTTHLDVGQFQRWSDQSGGIRPVWCHRWETKTHHLTSCGRRDRSAAPTAQMNTASHMSGVSCHVYWVLPSPVYQGKSLQKEGLQCPYTHLICSCPHV